MKNWAAVTHAEVCPSLFIPCYVTQQGDDTQTRPGLTVAVTVNSTGGKRCNVKKCTINYPPSPAKKNPNPLYASRKYLAHCLQPSAEKCLVLALSCFLGSSTCFERKQKQSCHQVKWFGWGCCHLPGQPGQPGQGTSALCDIRKRWFL